MGSPKLSTKELKDRGKRSRLKADVKRLNSKPVIKNVDIDAIRKSFEEKKA